MPRQSNGSSTVYQNKEGWHGRVTVGVRDDGRADRRHVRGKTKAEVTRKVRELERVRDSGRIVRPGESWTVRQWLEHWVENIAAPFVRPNTISGYRVAVYRHLIPGIGRHRLAALRPEHLERLYLDMMRTTTKAGTPMKAATAHQAHRTVRTALNEAVKRGYLASNPATLAKSPSVVEHEVEPYTVEEVQLLLAKAAERRNGARWAIALALGLRQGEALGLKWSDLDFAAQTLTVRRSRLRPRYAHGCEPACGRKHAGRCPDRRPLVPAADETKSKAGRRVIGLPSALVGLLQDHQTAQAAESAAAAQLWSDEGWVFASETGHPINPWTDWAQWKALLADAGVRDGRLHDARHTAATVLLLLGVHERAIMGIMGWSDTAMSHRYAHVVDPIRHEVASRLDNLFWLERPVAEPPRPEAN